MHGSGVQASLTRPASVNGSISANSAENARSGLMASAAILLGARLPPAAAAPAQTPAGENAPPVSTRTIPRRPIVNLRFGIRGYLTFTQGVDNPQQPPQAVGSAAVALPGGDVAGNRRRVVGAESMWR